MQKKKILIILASQGATLVSKTHGKWGSFSPSSFSSFSPAAKRAIDNGRFKVKNQKISFSGISSSLPKVSKLLNRLEDDFLATGRYFSVLGEDCLLYRVFFYYFFWLRLAMTPRQSCSPPQRAASFFRPPSSRRACACGSL